MSKGVWVTGSVPRMALQNSSSTRHLPLISGAMGNSSSCSAPLLPPRTLLKGGPCRLMVPSEPKIQKSVPVCRPVTVLQLKSAWAPQAISHRTLTWSGTDTACTTPFSSRRLLANTLVMAETRVAGPTYRMTASYQMPMPRML